jgi:hypothetical protein
VITDAGYVFPLGDNGTTWRVRTRQLTSFEVADDAASHDDGWQS